MSPSYTAPGFDHPKSSSAHIQSRDPISKKFHLTGMGESDKPFLRYSTSEMARDTIDLLDSIGWTANRQLHVVGVSMGSMIAQELVKPSSHLEKINDA